LFERTCEKEGERAVAVDTIDIEESVRSVQADLKYLLPGTPINRRFVSAGVEVNTGNTARMR
jgi:hypothetical protein